jgi:hypothetical protein
MEPAVDLVVINAQHVLAAMELAFPAFSGSQGFLEHVPSKVWAKEKMKAAESNACPSAALLLKCIIHQIQGKRGTSLRPAAVDLEIR